MRSLKEDPLVRVEDYGLLTEPSYFILGISEDSTCLVRRTAAEKLMEARTMLPNGFNFKIWDGYRKTEVQKRLYEGYFAELQRRNPDWNADRIHQGVREFIALPTVDPLKAAPHNTGGTVDLTLVDESGRELNMGTGFDHFDVEAHTFHFESAHPGTPEYTFHHNRMILYRALTGVGFYNFPEEWWHFSYGDLLWAKHHDQEPLYASCEPEYFVNHVEN